jgi:hypothetical protein
MRILYGVLIVAALVLSGCGMVDDEPGAQSPDGLVRTTSLATVLDDGDGAELCVGGVAESYPPQCSGPRLIGWDWAEHEGTYEEAGGVSWGTYALEGRYDAAANTFEVESVSDEPSVPSPAPEIDFSSPCEEPDGGWRVQDTSAVTMDDREAAFAVAESLDGYAGAWVDQQPHEIPSPAPGDDESQIAYEEAMNDPLYTVINVRVTGDTVAAEEKLRDVWSGMLCVTGAERSQAELLDIVNDLTSVPNSLGVGTDVLDNTVNLSVIYDDGALQRELDEKYGEGVVEVDSALVR